MAPCPQTDAVASRPQTDAVATCDSPRSEEHATMQNSPSLRSIDRSSCQTVVHPDPPSALRPFRAFDKPLRKAAREMPSIKPSSEPLSYLRAQSRAFRREMALYKARLQRIDSQLKRKKEALDRREQQMLRYEHHLAEAKKDLDQAHRHFESGRRKLVMAEAIREGLAPLRQSSERFTWVSPDSSNITSEAQRGSHEANLPAASAESTAAYTQPCKLQPLLRTIEGFASHHEVDGASLASRQAGNPKVDGSILDEARHEQHEHSHSNLKMGSVVRTRPMSALGRLALNPKDSNIPLNRTAASGAQPQTGSQNAQLAAVKARESPTPSEDTQIASAAGSAPSCQDQDEGISAPIPVALLASHEKSELESKGHDGEIHSSKAPPAAVTRKPTSSGMEDGVHCPPHPSPSIASSPGCARASPPRVAGKLVDTIAADSLSVCASDRLSAIDADETITPSKYRIRPRAVLAEVITGPVSPKTASAEAVTTTPNFPSAPPLLIPNLIPNPFVGTVPARGPLSIPSASGGADLEVALPPHPAMTVSGKTRTRATKHTPTREHPGSEPAEDLPENPPSSHVIISPLHLDT